MVKVGLIGGTGLEDLNILEETKTVDVSTPYGSPSSSFYTGLMGQCEIVICSRHGRGHAIPPTFVNNRANIAAMKSLGCHYILATTACGSLREEIKRGDFVIPDQFIDFTRHRVVTFFEEFEQGNMKHTPMADPFNEYLRGLLIESAMEQELPFHAKGTLISIEGSRFSTRAESRMYRILGADVVNMSICPEAILANEAGIPYAAIALSTDYDAWREGESTVTWDEILSVFQTNVKSLTGLLINCLKKIKIAAA